MRATVFVPLSVVLAVPLSQTSEAQVRPGGAGPSALETSGPYTHENLTVFLFHDPSIHTANSAKPAGTFVSLEEALDRKQVVITDEGNVNRLYARNTGNAPIYLQGGDIVKGGRQDRVLEHDTILEPNGKKVAVAAFCVEQGRWHARGSEPSSHFASSKDTLVTRKQKLAAKAAANQGEVWQSVAEAQAKMGANMGGSVAAAESATSLQLSLENKHVRASAERYLAALSNVVKRQDTVGYAFAVNGEISAADVYASPVLFRKLWPKLLRASAIEAVAEARAGQTFRPVTTGVVKQFIADAESGRRSEEKVSPRTTVEKRDSRTAVMFDTRDVAAPAPTSAAAPPPADAEAKPVHRSYLRK
jgi:hypothetical protein